VRKIELFCKEETCSVAEIATKESRIAILRQQSAGIIRPYFFKDFCLSCDNFFVGIEVPDSPGKEGRVEDF